MAIVPLLVFDAGELPGVLPRRLYPTTDITSHWRILRAVSRVAEHCISCFVAVNNPFKATSLTFVSETGWHPVGEYLFVSFSSGFVQAAINLAAVYRATAGYWRVFVGYAFAY